MHISPSTKINELIQAYPFITEYLISLSPKYKLLTNPVARKTVSTVTTISQAAGIGGFTTDGLMKKIVDKIHGETGEDIAVAHESGNQPISDPRTRRETLKEIIRELHQGATVQQVKPRFQALISQIEPREISGMEQDLMKEGIGQEEIKRLCDVHVRVFEESLEHTEPPSTPPGHPLHTFMLENRAAERILSSLARKIGELGDPPSLDKMHEINGQLSALLQSISQINIHYTRKENQLFPALERHEVTGPTQVMWAIHDDIRKLLKDARLVLDKNKPVSFLDLFFRLSRAINDMIYKEERILYPLALETLDDSEWTEIRDGENEIGYAWVIPKPHRPRKDARKKAIAAPEGTLAFQTGRMTLDQANLLLTNLPVDLTYVNEQDEVIYYSATADRIFPRSPGVIGRKVQNCHPPKSVHVVQKILDSFRDSSRTTADFWIEMGGRIIYIRYIALRDGENVYRGCLEITQDITDIKKLEGERRLLDW